jgi:hypothetical protein
MRNDGVELGGTFIETVIFSIVNVLVISRLCRDEPAV